MKEEGKKKEKKIKREREAGKEERIKKKSQNAN